MLNTIKEHLNICYKLTLMALLFCHQVNAQQTLELFNTQQEYSLSTHISLFEDPSKTMEFDEVVQAKLFKQSNGNRTFPAYSESVFWIRVKVVNHTNISEWILEKVYANSHYLDLYYQAPGKQKFNVKSSGNLRPYSLRDLPGNKILFQLPILKNQESIFYLRYESDSTINFDLKIWSPYEYLKNNQREFIYRGIYLGLLILLILMNVVFLILGNTSHQARLLCLIVSAQIMIAIYDGSLQRFIPDTIAVLALPALPFSIFLTLYLLVLFIHDYSDQQVFKDKLRHINKNVVLILVLVTALTLIKSYPFYTILHFFQYTLIFCYVTTVVVMAWKTQNFSTRLMFIGCIFFIVCLVTQPFILFDASIFQHKEYYIYWGLLTFALLATFSSFMHIVESHKKKISKLQSALPIDKSRKVTLDKSLSGENANELLQHLVLQVSNLFNPKYAFVAKVNLPENTDLTTVAIVKDSRLVENITFSFENMPCVSSIYNKREFYPNNVQVTFPHCPLFQEMHIESFLGYRLNGASSVCLGMLVMLDDKPMQDIEQFNDQLEIYSSRAATELKRDWLDRQGEETHRRLMHHVQNNPMAFIECDKSFLVKEWNNAAEQIFGYQKKEATGRSIFELIFPDSGSSDESVHAVITNQNGRFTRTINICAQGNELTCDWYNTIVTSEEGDFLGFTSLIDDVTIEQRAISKVAEQELEHREILDAMTDAVISVDDLGHICMFNRAAEKLLGYATSDIMGKQVAVLLSHMSSNIENLQLADFVPNTPLKTDQYFINNEIQISHKNGSKLPVRLAVASLPNQHKFIICCHDLREYKKQQDQIRRSQKMDALGKLTGGIAHDFNNMLGVIQGYCDLIRLEPYSSKNINFIDEIHRTSERGAKLTQRLLSFSKIQSLDPDITNINQLLLSNQGVLARTLTSRVQVTYTLDQDLWSVLIDSSEFEDLLLNLAINSMHAIKDTGSIFITTKNMFLDNAKALTLSLKTGCYVFVSLRDTGCGIDKNKIDNIFEPFFTTKKYGNGLGLSQVYGFMKRSGGTITVSSRLEEGATFSLYFPAKMEAAKAVQSRTVIDKIDTAYNNIPVLVVDDEPDLLNVVVLSLRKYGYVVYEAKDAQAALKVLEHDPIDVVVSDVIMPKTNGYELAKLIRNKYPEIKIQLVSGFNDNLNASEQDDRYFHKLLVKPYKISELHQRIQHLFNDTVTSHGN